MNAAFHGRDKIVVKLIEAKAKLDIRNKVVHSFVRLCAFNRVHMSSDPGSVSMET